MAMAAPMTEMQQRFAVEYASNGGNATAAAKAAGYSEKSAHEIARQLLEKPWIREAIFRELAKLRYRAGAVGLDALVRLAQSEKTPAAARVAAARALCEHAGLLGTAKDTAATRAAADAEEDGARNALLDPREVLATLARRPGMPQ
jgi:hypothetical protein